MLSTLQACAGVKEVEREGWKRKAGVPSPESVADHLFSTTLAAMMAGDLLHLDTCKMMRMALLHDVCEAATGDIQPGAMLPSKKEELESYALTGLLGALPLPLKRKYLKDFSEFNRGTSREAVLVRELDKIEMVVQASTYERRGVRSDLLDEFWRTADGRVKSKRGREILTSAASLRPPRSTP